MTMSVPVRVVDQPAYREWRDAPQGVARGDWCKQKIADTGETVMFWFDDGDATRFSLICPGCGCVLAGQIGDEPVSGWDEPRWVNSGTREKPTLTPSLGCGGWRRGECIGHWWLRDGELMLA